MMVTCCHEVPGSVLAAGTGRDFRFTLRGTTLANSAIRYTLALRGRRLSLTGGGSVNGTPVSVRLIVTRQGR